MQSTTFALLAMTVVSLFVGSVTAIAAIQPQVPTGISDLLAAMPTMLSPMDQRKRNTLRTGNTITIAGSKIVFARSDKPTLAATIESMIANSEPSKVGDQELTKSILTVLEADGSEQETEVTKQIKETLECRAHKARIRKCVQTLVDVAVPADVNNEDDDLAAEMTTRGDEKK